MTDLIGVCDNAFWDRWDGVRHINYRHCTQPAVDMTALGLPGVRNLCARCGAHSATFSERHTANIAESMDAAGSARWLAGSHTRYLESCWYAYQCAAASRPLAEIRKQQAHADGIAQIINALVARWANEIYAEIRAGHLDPDDIGLTFEDLQPRTLAGAR